MPLVKPVTPSSEIRNKFCVMQNRVTGEIAVSGDYRSAWSSDSWSTVIDFTYYYPYSFPSPFAAYLVPRDLAVGEHVFLEDLIEDVVGRRWNQGDTYRLQACVAIWNGSDFELCYDTDTDAQYVLG